MTLFGAVFGLQGDGIIGGSAMSGNSFWVYAGGVIAVVGLVLAVLGFYLASRKKLTQAMPGSDARGSASSSVPESQDKK